MIQVQLRVPEELVREIDLWVKEGRFKSRSDAIKTIVALYEEREKTRQFYKMLVKRSEEMEKDPDRYAIPLKDVLNES